MPAESKTILILQELPKVLMFMQQVNNCWNDLKKVYDEVVPIDELKVFPCIVIEEESEVNKNAERGGNTSALFEKRMKLLLHCWLNAPAKQIQITQRRFKHDLEYVLFKDRAAWTLNGTCQEIMITRFDYFGTLVDTPNCGMTVELDVHYQQRLNDPTKGR